MYTSILIAHDGSPYDASLIVPGYRGRHRVRAVLSRSPSHRVTNFTDRPTPVIPSEPLAAAPH